MRTQPRTRETATAAPRAIPDGERFNVASHAAAAAVHPLVSLILAVRAAELGAPTVAAAFAVHGVGMSLAFAASTLFHAAGDDRRGRLRRLDRAAIFAAVAGFHTANAVVSMPAAGGMLFIFACWAFAFRQIRLEMRAPGGCGRESVAPYLVLGWAGIVTWRPLIAAVPVEGRLALVAAMVVLTCGAAVIRCDALPRKHEIWHVLVVAGNVLALAGWGSCCG